MRWNLSSQKLSKENQSLWVSLSYNTQSWEFWNFTTISSKILWHWQYEELEMDTDSVYLALSEENWKDVIFLERRNEWDQLRSKYCTDDFTANATDIFFPRICCIDHKKHDKRAPGLFKEEVRCAEMLCLFSKTYRCYDKQTNKHKFSSKRLNKRTLEECGDGGPRPKYRKVLEEAVNVTSTNRGFRTSQHSVATCEQTKKGLSYFCPKRIVEEDGIHTKPLPL